jgi:hypothetical protein
LENKINTTHKETSKTEMQVIESDNKNESFAFLIEFNDSFK